MASVATRQPITLKGSTEIVTEFFGYAVNSILFQRGIYAQDSFKPVKKYEMQLMLTSDKELQVYLSQILKQVTTWLMKSTVKQLTLVVTGIDSQEVLERWVFDVKQDDSSESAKSEKSVADIKSEIRAILLQVTASVSFLPLLQEPCTFELLVSIDKDAAVPSEWETSDPKYIDNAQIVKLRSFSTTVHKVDSIVAFKADGC